MSVATAVKPKSSAAKNGTAPVVKSSWFEVSREALKKQVGRKSRASAMYELLQNSWDENTTRVTVDLHMVDGSHDRAHLVVTDDSPDGFADIAHAYTMFAESSKKYDAEKRGRFNIGEKMVLSLCDTAKVVSVNGAVQFNADGTREDISERTTVGSRFEAIIDMTFEQLVEALEQVQLVLVPEHISTIVNGERLPSRKPVERIKAVLMTEIAGDNGVPKRTNRSSHIEIYQKGIDEEALIYEMGLPVMPLDGGDKWHINICQKIPQNMDRDSVGAPYVQVYRAHIFNRMGASLTAEETTKAWVQDALRVSPKKVKLEGAAVKAMLETRFGKCVTRDPSDPEANNRAIAEGYKLVEGGIFDKEQWANIKDAEAIESAGRVFPTQRPEPGDSLDPNAAPPFPPVPFEEWTPGMRYMYALAKKMAFAILGKDIVVKFVTSQGPNRKFAAWYGHMGLVYNLSCPGHGKTWYDYTHISKLVDLWIHECAHDKVSNHLSSDYFIELTRLGGECTWLALTSPEIFDATPEILDGTDAIFEDAKVRAAGVDKILAALAG